MRKKLKIGIIGFGNMGSSFYKAIAASGSYRVCVYDKLKKKTRGICACRSIEELITLSEVIILAIKPQAVSKFMFTWAESFAKRNILLLSIAAGVSTETLESYAKRLKVVRVMPNLCAQVLESVSFLAKGKAARGSDLAKAKKILSYMGRAIVCQESYMDKATAISGSGPGYVFYFMSAVYKAALGFGFSCQQSREIVSQTFYGAALTAKASKKDFEALMKAVASKGGTTQAAFKVFRSQGLDKIIINAVKAAHKRGQEL